MSIAARAGNTCVHRARTPPPSSPRPEVARSPSPRPRSNYPHSDMHKTEFGNTYRHARPHSEARKTLHETAYRHARGRIGICNRICISACARTWTSSRWTSCPARMSRANSDFGPHGHVTHTHTPRAPTAPRSPARAAAPTRAAHSDTHIGIAPQTQMYTAMRVRRRTYKRPHLRMHIDTRGRIPICT